MPARMSGESTDAAAQPRRAGDERAMRIAEHDARAHADELVDEEQPRLEHLFVDENEPGALRRRDDRDRHRVGRKRRPRLVLELRHVSAEIALNDRLLSASARDDEIGSVDHARDAEPREAHQRRAQMLDARVRDANLGARHRRQADERADLDVIRPDAMRRAAERTAALHRQLVRARPVDLRAERDQEVAEVLDVRLAGGIAENRRSARGDGRHERVLGAGDARLVEKHVGAAQARRREVEAVVQLERRAEALEREKMRVDAPPADDVAAGRRQAESRRSARASAPRGGSTRESSGTAPDRGATTTRSSRGCGAYCGRPSATSTPVDAISSTSVSTSRIRGTFSSMTGWSVSSAAHTIGSAAFLFPDGRIVPDSFRPPSTTYCSALMCVRRLVRVRRMVRRMMGLASGGQWDGRTFRASAAAALALGAPGR